MRQKGGLFKKYLVYEFSSVRFIYNMLYMYTMPVQITIREVDPKVFREFKADAVRNGFKLGTAITLAMHQFRSKLNRRGGKLTDLHPTHWGKGTEHLSEEIDSVLYGE